jgi:cyclic pyranopterin phosphate synthase
LVDITNKITTLRTAKAQAIITFSRNTLELIKKDLIPKGNIFQFAKSAAFFAAKKTDQLLPHCHPVGIDSMRVDFELIESEIFGIKIISETKFIGKTGIEMETLTGVTVAALTIYDMLKPIDKNLEIGSIKLLEKTGGKSSRKYFNTPPLCAVLVCSDSTYMGTREDNSGKAIVDLLEKHGIKDIVYKILPDEKLQIQNQIKDWVNEEIAYIFTTGGTGLSPRDQTVEAIKEIIEREAPGISEAMRAYGQERTPVAMMSRSIAGTLKNTTILALPGSTSGATESLSAVIPAIFHSRKMLKGGNH